jgi:hypothetical protein
MMGILVPETCWGNKTAYFVASGWFFTFTMPKMRGHMNFKISGNIKYVGCSNICQYSEVKLASVDQCEHKAENLN